MGKQKDNTPVLAIIVTGWLITIIMILILIDHPELTRNDFFALCLSQVLLWAFYGIFLNNLKGD